jgi:hypothetical protein
MNITKKKDGKEHILREQTLELSIIDDGTETLRFKFALGFHEPLTNRKPRLGGIVDWFPVEDVNEGYKLISSDINQVLGMFSIFQDLHQLYH